MVVLAIDIGTGSCKGALYDESGARIADARREYVVSRPQPGWAEQDPDGYLAAARDVSRELASGREIAGASNMGREIAAIGFSTQTPTLVCCDAAGDPVRPAVIWQDTRAQSQSAWLESTALETRREWFGTDLPVGAATAPAKLLWLAAQPEWARTRWIAQPKDYLIFRLTGEWVADPWCAKGLAHLDAGALHPEWLRRLGKTEPPCPAVRHPYELAGRALDASWGAPEGTPVCVGWSDALSGILATGAFHEPRAFVLSGTSEIVGCSGRAFTQARGLFHAPGSVFPLTGLGLHYGPTDAGGATLEWIARLLGRTPAEALALAREAAPSDLMFRPYLSGERAPFWDHTLTAAFDGLRSEHGAADLVRALLEGVALHERLVLETAGAPPDMPVVLAGGGARDALWNRIRADILQRPLLVDDDTESSLRGAAWLAFAAIGRAPGAWFQASRLDPNPDQAPRAAALFGRFRQPIS